MDDDLETWKKTTFEQRWIHARHVEIERSALLSVYAAIVSGCLAVMKEKFLTREAIGVQIFLILPTLIWLGLCVKLGEIFTAHTTAAEDLLPPGIPKMLSIFKGRGVQRISVRRLLILFFVVCFLALSGVVIYVWAC